MAVTKIHPIKSTLKKAIDYICNGDKTADEVYVTTHLCSRENAHKEFELTKKQFGSRTKTIAHHLIQSFAPGEVSFEEAHEVGIKLCDSILGGEFEYVLATHIDKGHVHNHIIFNSIDSKEGKIYRSYYGSYMNIRNQSDRLCKEHNLSVIDQETQREINEIRRRRFVNWYDWNEDKKGNSYKSRLQFDIDRSIEKAQDWQSFLKLMESFGYEVKEGKHIAFKGDKQQRFTRARTIGDNYTEEKIKERITNKDELKLVIDRTYGKKKGVAYEQWVTRYNLKAISESLSKMKKKGYNTRSDLSEGISRIQENRDQIKLEYKRLEDMGAAIKSVIKDLEVCINKYQHYEGYRKNPNDSIYKMMNKKDIESYKKAYTNLKKFATKYPEFKDILDVKGDFEKAKEIVRRLNKESSSIQTKNADLKKNFTALSKELEEVKLWKQNLDIYLGKEDSKEKPSTVGLLNKYKQEINQSENKNYKKVKEQER